MAVQLQPPPPYICVCVCVCRELESRLEEAERQGQDLHIRSFTSLQQVRREYTASVCIFTICLVYTNTVCVCACRECLSSCWPERRKELVSIDRRQRQLSLFSCHGDVINAGESSS